MFVLVLWLCFFAAILSIILFSWHCGISPTPSSPSVKNVFDENLVFQGNILELGCGFGGMAVFLAKRYPQKKVYAYEISWIPFLVAKLRAIFVPNLVVKRGNFLEVSHESSGLIFCYLSRRGMRELKEKWEKYPPKSKVLIISNTFRIEGWKEKKKTLNDLFSTNVFFYELN